jgi:hypothetical protein
MKYLLEFDQYLSDDIQDLNNDGKKENPISASASIGFKNFDPDQVVVIGQYQNGEITDELFRTTAGLINEINQGIKDETNKWYGTFGYKYSLDKEAFDIKIGEGVINTEYLMKMVNNRTVFYRICKNEKITNSDDFLNFMKDFSNLEKYYHYKGVFFKEVLEILIAATRKGNKGERAALNYFRWLMKVKGPEVTIYKPTLREDVRGIDGKFKFENSEIEKTIQVKPYENFSIDNRVGTATSNGSLSMNTDILILYKGIGTKVVRNSSDEEVSYPDFSFIIADKKDVKIVGNQFILTKWQAKGEKLK